MSTSQHPVTEFAFLNLIPPTTVQTPQLISGFLEGVTAQSAWSGYPLHLFIHRRPTQPSETAPNELENTPVTTTAVYIISGWASVQAHNEWIASPKNQEIMRFFGDANMMSVGGLAHLDIDFTKLSFGECSTIVWRKRDASHDWETSRPPVLKETPAAIAQNIVDDQDRKEPGGRPKVRVLWSYRGWAVDDGVEDEYELTGYSDGELQEFGEGYTVIRKWDIEAHP